VNPFEFLDELFIPKTRVLALSVSVSEDFVIIACVVLTQCQCVTDRQTGRQTDIRQCKLFIIFGYGDSVCRQLSRTMELILNI